MLNAQSQIEVLLVKIKENEAQPNIQYKNRIKEFLQEIQSQNNRGTQKPIYFVIRDTTPDFIQSDSQDSEPFIFVDGLMSFENYKNYTSEDITKKDFEKLDHIIYGYWSKKERFSDAIFLTEKDAKLHLEKNKHHYSDDATTYVKCIWRAPYLQQFIEDLLNYFDIKGE